jgi:hypothetical protein
MHLCATLQFKRQLLKAEAALRVFAKATEGAVALQHQLAMRLAYTMTFNSLSSLPPTMVTKGASAAQLAHKVYDRPSK